MTSLHPHKTGALLLSAWLFCIVFTVRAQQAPVPPHERILGYLHLQEPNELAASLAPVFAENGRDANPQTLCAQLSGFLGDPRGALMPHAGNVLIAWVQGIDQDLVTVAVLPAVTDGEYLRDCLGRSGYENRTEHGLTFLHTPGQEREVGFVSSELAELHGMIQPADITLSLRGSLLAQWAPRVALVLETLPALKPRDFIALLPDTTGNWLDPETDPQVYKPGAWFRLIPPLLANVEHFSLAAQPADGMLRTAWAITATEGSDLARWCDQDAAETNTRVRYLAEDGSVKLAFGFDGQATARLLRELARETGMEDTTEEALGQAVDWIQPPGCLQRISEDEGWLFLCEPSNRTDAAEDIRATVMPFIADENTLFVQESDPTPERFPVDHVMRKDEQGEASILSIALVAGDTCVTGSNKQVVMDTYERVRRVLPLSDPLLAQQRFIDGGHFYLDARPASQITVPWSESTVIEGFARVQDRYMQAFLVFPFEAFSAF